jgi:hypothetical protein
MPLRPHLIWVLLLLAACHSTPPASGRDTYDSTNVKPGKGLGSVPGVPDSIMAEINAPDTVFEDGSRPTSWSSAGFDDPTGFKLFLLRFRGWVKKDKVDSIASHIRYPMRGAGSAGWFKEQYAHIFNKRIKNVLVQQRLDRIFRNGQGAMIGNGDLWFKEDKGQYWLIAVN